MWKIGTDRMDAAKKNFDEFTWHAVRIVYCAAEAADTHIAGQQEVFVLHVTKDYGAGFIIRFPL